MDAALKTSVLVDTAIDVDKSKASALSPATLVNALQRQSGVKKYAVINSNGTRQYLSVPSDTKVVFTSVPGAVVLTSETQGWWNTGTMVSVALALVVLALLVYIYMARNQSKKVAAPRLPVTPSAFQDWLM